MAETHQHIPSDSRLIQFPNMFAKNIERPNELKRPAPTEDIQNEQTLKFGVPTKVVLVEENQPDRDQNDEVTVNNSQVFKKLHSQASINLSSQGKADGPCVPLNENSEREKVTANFADLKNIREKYSDLLPPYMSVKLSKFHLFLLDCARKIDEFLTFQRSFRNKKSEFFGAIRSNLIQNINFFVDVEHFRKILYLAPNYYVCTREKLEKGTEGRFDLRVSLPFGKVDLNSRRVELRKKLYDYVCQKHKQFAEAKSIPLEEVFVTKKAEGNWVQGFNIDRLDIPSFQFQHEKNLNTKEPATQITNEIQARTIPWLQRTSSECNRSVASQGSHKADSFKIDAYSVLDKSLTESFKDRLYRIVAEKEKFIQEQKAKEAELAKKYVVSEGVHESQCLLVMEMINLLYVQRGLSNMFEASVIEQLQKRRITLNRREIEDCIEKITKLQDAVYLKKIVHPKGVILQINKQGYSHAKAKFEQMIKVINQNEKLLKQQLESLKKEE